MNTFTRTMFLSVLLTTFVANATDLPKTNLHWTMLTKVNPNGLALWDITNNATGNDGLIDAKLVKTEDWARLVEIGKALEEGGKALSSSAGVVVAAPGSKLQDEDNPGASTAADVQRYLDARPAEFRKHAQQLQRTGAKVIQSAKARDTKTLGEVANSLDAVCEDCHVIFWYPQQQK
jgi:hypothetical protein